MNTQYSFLDKNFTAQPVYIVDDDYFTHCDIHGDWCANSCYDQLEISEMIAKQGFVDCPECLREIVGIE